ncbi:unnamed protein product [Symbiodinium sp. CCMP2592]|nr:unnamed protein product [Symbiodinium sp. CCMP2592]
MSVASFASGSQDNSPEWQGWMLPVQQDGHLLHVSYYASDVAAFAEMFMLKTGLKKMGQRQLPGNMAGENIALVEGGFFRQRRMDQLKIVTSCDGGYGQWWSSLPQEDSGFRSLWITADGYFYCLARKQMKVCAKVFTTPMYTIEAEVLKGDLYESDGDFRFSRKMEVSCGWTGESSYDWNFTLDGFAFDRAITFKKIPIVVKFSREADSKGRPFELHMSRCAKWCSGVDQAMRSSKSQLNSAGTSSGDAAASDPAPWN